tara:strand:+ start:1595 stop:2362 length:768 start_codon:yes stop_codon:yes gene_type:complete
MAAKGVAIKLKSYEETIPKVLRLIKLDQELKKHEKIVLKPNLIPGFPEISTKPEFLSQVLDFCIKNKNPGSEIFIAEGCDGAETQDIFDEFGFSALAEKYGVGLIDLNQSETQEIENSDFLRFEQIHYPNILLDSFIISLPLLGNHSEIDVAASLDNMLGAFPSKHYSGFFSSKKNKLKHTMKYQIHDIIACKMPDLAIIDANEQGLIITGNPLEMDKQSAKALGLNWKNIPHLKLIDESLSTPLPQQELTNTNN